MESHRPEIHSSVIDAAKLEVDKVTFRIYELAHHSESGVWPTVRTTLEEEHPWLGEIGREGNALCDAQQFGSYFHRPADMFGGVKPLDMDDEGEYVHSGSHLDNAAQHVGDAIQNIKVVCRHYTRKEMVDIATEISRTGEFLIMRLEFVYELWMAQERLVARVDHHLALLEQHMGRLLALLEGL